jgi:hypothetical protein
MKKKKITIPTIGKRGFTRWARMIQKIEDPVCKTIYNQGIFYGKSLYQGSSYIIEVGTLILVYGEQGSSDFHHPCAQLYKVGKDGLLFLREGRDENWQSYLREIAIQAFVPPDEKIELAKLELQEPQ